MAKNLGKDMVAEGVQTRSQFEALIEQGVNMVQGYFIAPPLPKEVAESLLERTAERDPDTLVVIKADTGVEHGRVVTVMDLARGRGLTRLAIATEVPEEE